MSKILEKGWLQLGGEHRSGAVLLPRAGVDVGLHEFSVFAVSQIVLKSSGAILCTEINYRNRGVFQ